MIADKMAVKIEEIDSPEKLEEYLIDKPIVLTQFIAMRCALRVYPRVFFAPNSDEYNKEVLKYFGICFRLWTVNNNPRYGNVTTQSITKSINSKFFNFFLGKHSGIALKSIIFAARAVAYEGRGSRIAAADTAREFVMAMELTVDADENANFSEAAQEKAISEYYVWEEISNDIKKYIKFGEGLGLKKLIDAPLWQSAIPDIILKDWNALKIKMLAQDLNWRVWTDWYEYVLHGSNSPKRGIAALSEEKLIELAQKPNKFWERAPEDVNAEIAGWLEEAQTSKADDKNNQNEYAKTDSNPRRNYSKLELNAVKSTVEINRESIALSSASTLLQISDFREKVRGNNQLELMFREGLLGFLDALSGDLEKLSELTLKLVTDPTDENAENTLNWLNRFKSRFNDKCQEYIEPENIANAAVPTAIILSCGGIGSLLGGPLGFGAGTVFGKFLTGELKAGGATDKISKMFDADDNKKAAE